MKYFTSAYNGLKNRKQFFLMCGLVFGVAFALTLMTKPGVVHAAGGVGSSGTGGCASCNAGHHTDYGWSWAKYDTSGSGPTDGFRDGSSWATIQSTCQNAKAGSVYMFIILNSSGDGRAYNYDGVQYSGQDSVGTSYDHGRAITVSNESAQYAFSSLGSFGVSTSGFTFGSNVAWFCYDINNDKPPTGGAWANCGTISGWAHDDDEPNTRMLIDVWVDGEKTRVTADDSWAALGQPNNDHFTVNYPTDKKGSNGGYVDVYAINPNNLTYTSIGHVWVGPCLDVNLGTCDSLTGILGGSARDNEHPSMPVKVSVSIGGTSLGEYTANPGFNIPIPSAYLDSIQHTASITVYGIYANGNKDGISSRQITRTFTCPRMPECSNLTVTPISGDPGDPEPGQPFRLSVTAGITEAMPTGSPDVPFRIDVSIPGVLTGPLGTGGIRAGSQTSPPLTRDFLSGLPIGVYENKVNGYTITFTGTGKVKQCPASIKIVAKPIFTVSSGDIASGFNGTCQTGSDWKVSLGKLTGWNNSANSGSGTNLAVIALQKIDGVVSSKGKDPPTGLTFANRLSSGNTLAAGEYGGNYGATIDCPKNYYGQSASATPLPASGLDTSKSGDYKTTGRYYIGDGGLRIANDKRIALYVDGDVAIRGNILIGTGLSNFYLIARGNIYISPRVTQLDGVYIAQGDSNGLTKKGQIYTCARNNPDPGTSMPPVASMMNSVSLDAGGVRDGCMRNKLTVNGAFIADKINLYRSKGTLANASDPNQIAEEFNYTPRVWLAPPASIAPLFNSGSSASGSGSYDAITSLSPVL